MSIVEIAKNKKAYFDYEIIENFEAGIVLTGEEIKAIRAKKIQMSGSYVKILSGKSKKPEIFAINLNISKTKEADRTRKLLMHKKEISYLLGKTEQKNLTLIPLRIYIKNKRYAKLQFGLSKGRKKFDKRELLKKRDDQRTQERMIKEY